MDFRILGPLEVSDNGRALTLGGAKQRALLAILLLHANEVVPAERLSEDLWGDRQPSSGAKALHVFISQLRKVIGDERLLTRAPGYLLRLEPEELDATRFERLREQADGAEPGEAAAILREALSLWHGAPFADVAYESFAQSEIGRLEELRMGTLEQRIAADLALGRHAELVAELEALVRDHPLRERLREQLLLALYRSGRQAEALAAYQEARRVLVEELGIEPGKALRHLHQAILHQDPVLDVATVTEPAAPPESFFVGRDAEVAELLAGLDDAFAGRGRLFLLTGEPGIGKSRLAEEVIAHASGRGARILVGRCWEAGGAPAYWPWVESLRAYVREADSGTLRAELGAGAVDIAQIVPDVRHRFPDLAEPPSLESEGARFRLFDAISEFLRNAAARRPLVLVLDDLHAADAPSLLLLRFVTRRMGSMRMLVLAAFRDAVVGAADQLGAIRADVAREPASRRLSLRGLTEQDVAEYLELAAAEIASPELVAGLHEETEGNPLFVVETVRLLALEGVAPETAHKRIAVPQSVRDIIADRLARLSEESNRLLSFASVLGREFSLAALARFGGVSEHQLLDTLDEAMAAGVLTDVPGTPGRLRFGHLLIRDVTYDALTPARRAQLHRRASEVLELLHGDEPGAHLAELAHHAIAGSDFVNGLRYARLAGDRALALLAYEEAARLYESALQALNLTAGTDEGAQCELLIALGTARARAGDAANAKEVFLDAAETARRLGLGTELARAAAGYGGEIIWARAANDDRLIPLLEEGLAAVGDADVALKARLLARLAGALRDEHLRDRRDALSKQAVAIARRAEDPAVLASALDGRAAAIIAPDTVSEVLALGRELREAAERCRDADRIIAGHLWQIMALLQLGDIARAEVELARATRVAHARRQPARLWEVYGVHAMLVLAAGRLSEAETLIRETYAFGRRTQPEAATPVYRLQRYMLNDFLGRIEEVEPEIRDLVVEYPARPVFRCALARLHAVIGRPDEAAETLNELAADDFSALPFDQEWLFGMSLLAETAVVVGDTDSMPTLYRLLLPWAALNVVDQAEGIRGSLSHYLGMLAAAMQRWTEAEQHFADALATNTKIGARPWLAQAQQDFARMLLARGVAGDSRRATELLDQARSTYRELGMKAYEVRAVAGP